MLKRLILSVLLVLTLSAPTCAGWAEAKSAHDVGDHATAFLELRTLARLGDPLAQFDLGVMYSIGQGVTEDNVEALKWFRLSAYGGLPEAQLVLGIMLGTRHQLAQLFGGGDPEDFVEAERWYRLAANQGLAEAQFRLGRILEAGMPPTEDRTDLIELYRAAAEQGFTDAQESLAEIYRSQRPRAVKNDIEALKWYLVASDHCRPDVINARRDLIHARQDLGRLRSDKSQLKQGPPQVVEAFELTCLDLLSGVLTPEQMGEALKLADQFASMLGGRKAEPLQSEVLFHDTRPAMSLANRTAPQRTPPPAGRKKQ